MKTKETKLNFAINALLILIIALIAIFVYLAINGMPNTEAKQYEEENITISAITAEKTENIVENKEPLVIPLIETENTTTKQHNFSQVKNNKYYYKQLNSYAKDIYDSIESNLEKMKSGTYKIQLPSSVAEVLEVENGDAELNKCFQAALDALTLDRVDTFFIDLSKVNLLIKKTTYRTKVTYELEIQPADDGGYLANGINKENINTILSQIESVKNGVIANLNGSTYDKVLQVHDWIINNLEYDTEMSSEATYNIWGALIDKKAVCEGYAEAFKYILDELEIPCILVVGEATNSEGNTESHEWNYVQIDGNWYAVDTTWDDPIVRGVRYVTNSTKHKYFLKGSTEINKNHSPTGKISENGQRFKYPDLQSEDY